MPQEESIDHPKLRAVDRCTICRGHKDIGLVVCWSCYREKRMRYGNAEVERILDQEEKRL